MPKTPTDPLRTRLHDLTAEIETRLAHLRDFASSPGNTWLARGELQHLMALLSDMESLLEDIKQDDAENGY